jgi:hypothetical protein
MRGKAKLLGKGFVLLALATLLMTTVGCGHLKNVRDDLMDCGTAAVGYVPPVVPSAEEPQAVGFLPPAIGAYVELTEFMHLGFLYKATGDLEWDRRGAGVTIDSRRKIGLGPLHDVLIEQEPIVVNGYKDEQSELEGWRRYMENLKDPVFNAPAKVLIYEAKETSFGGMGSEESLVWKSLPWLSRGWQDWEMCSLEVAIPEPFILHSGFYFRVGVDPSQIVDLVVSAVGWDLYADAAYEWDGELKY